MIGLLAFIAVMAYKYVNEQVIEPSGIVYDNREGLAIAFNKDVDSLFTVDEFAIYVQALKFMSEEIGKGSSLDWTGPDEKFGGTIVVIEVTVKDGQQCKEFKQHVIHSEVKYDGLAKICSVGSTWEIFKIK